MGADVDSDTTAELAVRRYLQYLENPESLVDNGGIERLQQTVAEATDPIERLRALAELERAQQPNEADHRQAFIQHAKDWAEANGITPSAFQAMGVDRSVLQAAGLLPSTRRRSKRAQAGMPRMVTTVEIKAAVSKRRGEFTFADIANEVGGSPMTVRKAVNELIDDGEVERLGATPNWTQQGRAPIVFRRRT